MSIAQEKAALTRIITALLPLGWEPCKLDDGGDDLIDLSHMDTEDVVENCAAVDMCHLHFRDEACRVATVLIVWGNSPEELIADMSTNNGFDMAVDLALAKAFPEPDPIPTVDELVQQAGGDYWGSHPRYLRSDWQYEVSCGDTQLGYWDWVRSNLEQEAS